MKLPGIFSYLERVALGGLWRGFCWSCKHATYVDPANVKCTYELASLHCDACSLHIELWEKIE